jgi:hypothetical protein
MNFSQFNSDITLVDFVIKDFSALKNKRSYYEPLWRNLIKIFQPRSYNFLREYEDGQKFGSKTYFDYPALAAHKFALGMNGHMISRHEPWALFVTEDQRKMKSDRVKEYLQACAEQIMMSFGQSNTFYTSAYWTASDYGVIGTASVWPDEDKIDGKMVYKTLSCGSVYLRKNNTGKYIVFAQECKISAIDLLDKFGSDNLPPAVLQDAKGSGVNDNPFKEYDLLIYVSYNSEFVVDTINPEDKKYKVFYILHKESNQNKRLVMKSGRDNFPIVESYGDRYDNPYGISLGSQCLTTGLVGNKLVELMLDDANKAIRGIWRVSDTIGKLDLRAGGVNRINQVNEIIENVYQGKGFNIAREEFENLKQVCNEWFFINFFELLSNPDLPQITAYQAQRMQGEKVAMMSAAIGGFEGYLNQAIETQWLFEERAGRMPEPPEELFNDNESMTPIRPKFIGNLAQLQRQAFKTMGLIDWAQAVAQLSEVWPTMKIKVNELELVEQLAEGMGVQEKAVKDNDEVNRTLQKIQEAESQQAQAEQMAEGAKLIPALSKKVEAGSPAEFLAGAIQ